MEKLKFLILSLLSVSVIACSNGDEDFQDETIGLSSNYVEILGGVQQTPITTKGANWTLSTVTLSDGGIFTPNLKADKSFSYCASWLQIDYANGSVSFKVDDSYQDSYLNFELMLTDGSDEQTILGWVSHGRGIKPECHTLFLGAEGGEVALSAETPYDVWSMRFDDGASQQLNMYDQIGQSETMQWITLTKIAARQMLLTVGENTTGQQRIARMTL
jgi:hypothetical protein